MSFTVLENSTPASYQIYNNNMYHVAQGSIFPLDSTAMSYSTQHYNLGDSIYTWQHIYANNLNFISISSTNKTFKVFSNVQFLSDATTTIEFIDLNTSRCYYEFFGIINNKNTNTSDSIRLVLNNLSSSSYSYLYFFSHTNSVLGKFRASVGTYIPLSKTGFTVQSTFFHLKIMGHSNFTKIGMIYKVIEFSTEQMKIISGGAGFLSPSTLTSIKFYSPESFLANSIIYMMNRS